MQGGSPAPPAQLVRALRTVSGLVGLAERQHELADRDEGATLEDVVDLTSEILAVLDAAAEPDLSRPALGRRRVYTPEQEVEAIRLTADGLLVPQIAERLGLSEDTVRRIRRRAGGRAAGVVGATRPTPRSGWEARVRDAHARGLTTAEIGAELGYTVRTCQEYLARLGLRARKPSRRRQEETG